MADCCNAAADKLLAEATLKVNIFECTADRASGLGSGNIHGSGSMIGSQALEFAGIVASLLFIGAIAVGLF